MTKQSLRQALSAIILSSLHLPLDCLTLYHVRHHSPIFLFNGNRIREENYGARKVIPILQATVNGNSIGNNTPSPAPSRTLYEILEAPSTATREELKKRYISLSKSLHPDAIISRGNETTTNITISPDSPTFSDVADAWRTLSNPKTRKQYDRTLLAASFSDGVSRAASDMTSRTAPIVKNFFEEVAIPALRRTTATTAAVITAATDDLNKKYDEKEDVDFKIVLEKAMKAGMNVGKVIDRIELLEKSEKLYEKSKDEIKIARDLQKKLLSLITERIQLSLKTSNAVITSAEASFYLKQGLNVTKEKIITTSLLKRKNLRDEIQALEDVEIEFNEKLKDDEKVKLEFRSKKNNVKKAESDVERATMEVENAKEALRMAEEALAQSKQAAIVSSRDLSKFEPINAKSNYSLNRINFSLVKQREKVRDALIKVEENISNPKRFKMKSVSSVLPSFLKKDEEPTNGESEAEITAKISRMMEKEKVLSAECARARDRALNLKSSSKKLKARSEMIKKDNARRRT